MTAQVQPLPSFLVDRYTDWKSRQFEADRDLYQNLVEHGQHPKAMVISCCDSRVHSMALFGGKAGDFFIHRNIANLIPPFNPDGDNHGTSAAVEYAVTVLKVAHLIVLGHSGCGGINGGFHACDQSDGTPYSGPSPIQHWLGLLKPAFDKLDHSKAEDDRINDLEKLSILVSIENLMGFPFVQDALAEDRLSIHGLWHDIGGGTLYGYDASAKAFQPV
ncbi:MAG: carbonic anhydrase [Alphaproteobacteria bacterium]|nr:carbonic anhydrase [Alphaproteobacteria bacterium]